MKFKVATVVRYIYPRLVYILEYLHGELKAITIIRPILCSKYRPVLNESV